MRIAVISHEIDDFEHSGYLLNRLAAEWRSQGVSVAVLRGTDGPLPEADLAILHTDITVVDEAYARIVDHYPRVINGRVRDISKTVFSDLLVRRDSDWRGPVIVKTDMNYGGMREMEKRFRDGDMTSTITIQRPWRRVAYLDDYPIFDSPSAVPYGVWQNPNLVVEKFLPDRNTDGEYLLKVWVFLGDRDIYYQGVSNAPVVKGDNTLRREFLDPSDVPTSLRETRKRLGFDYGKFDFGLAGGSVALYDVNRTPAFPRLADEPPAITEAVRMLSRGLEALSA